MKKIPLSILAFAASLTMMGEGYQVNTLSVKQEGMAHTGVAQKLGSESMIFNPAGMGFMDKTIDISASVSPIFSTATATLEDGSKYKTENDFNGGSGSASNPFQIAEENQLVKIIDYPNAHFIQISDLDFENKATGNFFSKDLPFNGTYNGNGKKIKNIIF